MDNINKSLENWLNELNNFSYKDYENLPDLDLYMEQVINYLENQLSIFKTSSLDKQITSSMINNYVKGKVVDAPIKKKYNKSHIASIEQICTLKQVLSIAEVKEILDSEFNNKTCKAESFASFNKLNNEKVAIAVEEAFKNLNQIEENDTEGLIHLGLEFALTANAYINITKRILYYVRAYTIIENNKKKKKENTVEEKTDDNE